MLEDMSCQLSMSCSRLEVFQFVLTFVFFSVGMFSAAKKCGLEEGDILVSDL